MNRCDLRTRRECDCEPSGKPCHFQPGAFEIIRDANNKAASQGPWAIITISVAVGLLVFAVSAKVGFERQARAYEISGRV